MVYADNRYSYFSRGLGWQQQGDYGFLSGNDTLYFSGEIVQLSSFSGDRNSVYRFTMQYQDGALWTIYERPSGAKLSVGSLPEKQIEWVFGDFALAVYGYGVTPEEINSVFESFSSTQLD